MNIDCHFACDKETVQGQSQALKPHGLTPNIYPLNHCPVCLRPFKRSLIPLFLPWWWDRIFAVEQWLSILFFKMFQLSAQPVFPFFYLMILCAFFLNRHDKKKITIFLSKGKNLQSDLLKSHVNICIIFNFLVMWLSYYHNGILKVVSSKCCSEEWEEKLHSLPFLVPVSSLLSLYSTHSCADQSFKEIFEWFQVIHKGDLCIFPIPWIA